MTGNNLQFKKEKRQGFTLIELLISITIVGLIATITVVNFRAGQKRDELEIAARELAVNIKQAQVAALSQELIEGAVPGGGYGLYFPEDSNSYIYFADNNATYLRESAEDFDIRQYDFFSEIQIVSPDAYLVFQPPKPSIYINGTRILDELQIILRHQDIAEEKIVTVNRISGRVDIN